MVKRAAVVSDKRPQDRGLVVALLFIALVAAAMASLGAPLITAVSKSYHVSLTSSQWSLTLTLLVGAVATPILGRFGTYRRRQTVIAALWVVVVGSCLTLAPPGTVGFALLLIGRGAQGLSVAMVALMMAVARDHLGDRAPSVVSLLSVASVAGVGIGYPLAGLLAQIGGPTSAYGLGLLVAVAALVTASRTLPRSDGSGGRARTTEHPPTDWRGGLLLSGGIATVLIASTMADQWRSDPARPDVLLGCGLALIVLWVRVELRTTHPLVDLRAFRHPAVAGANVATFTGGVGLYILFVSITRFVQTGSRVGYGFGLSDFEAGLVVFPFSVVGFFVGRLAARLQQWIGSFGLLAANCVLLMLASCVLAVARSDLVWPVLAMVILGGGVGGFWAAMPGAILASTPQQETAAVMSVNQLLRSFGFSFGSVVSGLILAGYTQSGAHFPREIGYAVSSWVAFAVCGLTLVEIAITARFAGAHIWPGRSRCPAASIRSPR